MAAGFGNSLCVCLWLLNNCSAGNKEMADAFGGTLQEVERERFSLSVIVTLTLISLRLCERL